MTAAADWVPPWLVPVFDQLEGAYVHGRLPHAILVDGPPGWGKRFLVRQFARRLLGLPGRDPQAVAFGDESADVDLLAHRDVRIVQRSSTDGGRLRRQILIDQIRDLGEFLVRTAGAGGQRIAILELAEELNVNAANALLKRLEEPGDGCHLLLVSERLTGVLPTIRSRCQRVGVAGTAAAGALEWLRGQLPDAADAESLLALAGGAPLLARERAESEVPELAEAVAGFLRGDGAQALLGDDRDRADQVLELLYRAVADGVRGPDGIPAAGALRYLDRIVRARRMLRSQSNPNVVLLLEDLLLGYRRA